MTTDLEELWARIARPRPGDLNARRHPDSDLIWCAVDDAGRRHLLVELEEGDDERLLDTRGLAASIDTLALAGGEARAWVDVVCLDPALGSVFASVAEDLVSRVATSPGGRRGAVAATLSAWQWFWDRHRPPLSAEEALGLFAELWFLDRWAPLPGALAAWRGPLGGRHDFVAAALSVEVKATRVRTDGPAKHRITHLDQLADPETGELLLFSLRASPDELASNNLSGLVARLGERLAADPVASARFQNLLERAGWQPGQAQHYRQGLRVLGEELYSVDATFPKLTVDSFAGGLAPGVGEVSYSIDLAAAAGQLLATRPEQAATRLAVLGG